VRRNTMKKYDFQGWATKNNVVCSDGITIMQDAFKHNDGKKVPIIWNHDHTDPTNVLGHGILENRPGGVWIYGSFNDTEKGQIAKELAQSGDLDSLSIFASQLRKIGPRVANGDIKEVSLVLAGANPEAKIETVLRHSDDGTEDAYIRFIDEDNRLIIQHSEKDDEYEEDEEDEEMDLDEIIDGMTDEQQGAVAFLLEQAMNIGDNEEDDDDYDEEDFDDDDDEEEFEEEEDMKHNYFQGDNTGETLMHSDMIMAAISDGRRFGSMKEAFIAHGITNLEVMFPDAMDALNGPVLKSREMTWVQNVMTNTHHSPFARIKTVVADITEEEARAKGYIKGHLKKEEVFSMLKRTTVPTTVYKKQKMDRDDIIDISGYDVLMFLKAEMRVMLDEELARAFLVGDGRLVDSEDKIKEDCIRPIWKDADLYSVKVKIEAPVTARGDDRAKAFIRAIVKNRKQYKGSGSPTGYLPEGIITDCLLLTDTTGRDLYEDVEKLAKKLRLKEIISVPIMDGLTRVVEGKTLELLGEIVNLTDYNVGTDKGGEVNMFDDFDIDFNQQKYLIETRCSGALVRPNAAIIVEQDITVAQG